MKLIEILFRVLFELPCMQVGVKMPCNKRDKIPVNVESTPPLHSSVLLHLNLAAVT